MNQQNISAMLQQQMHLHTTVRSATSDDCLIGNTFGMMEVESVATQGLLNQIDLYGYRQQQQQQQQKLYQQHEEQQRQLQSPLQLQSHSQSRSQSHPSTPSSPSSLSSLHSNSQNHHHQHRQHHYHLHDENGHQHQPQQHNRNYHHNQLANHNHYQQQQQLQHHQHQYLDQRQQQQQQRQQQQNYHFHQQLELQLQPQPQDQQQQLEQSEEMTKHSISLSSSPTLLSPTTFHANPQQLQFNFHRQMKQQQQQNTNSTTSSANILLSKTEAPFTTSPNSALAPQQQQHTTNNNTSPLKSCWCFGESVCSGIEVEIDNINNNFHHGDTTYHMKILVPAVASGAIIGKGGETIASLQKDSGARVKMSKSHDFYPGTTERVCLITGSVEGILSVLDFIMDKIREKPDMTTKIIDAEVKQQEREKQVKILVPNSTAGMIIGKGGAFIKQIKEESGSYVQISQKPKDISLQERCITIIGEKENNKNACKMILSKIVEDPQSGTCLNVSYADISGPVANFNPTGSPYATNQNAINSSTASLNTALGTTIGGAATAAGLLVNGTAFNLSLNLTSPNPAPNLAVATQYLEHIKVFMRGLGYSETATAEMCAALGVLAKHGVLNMGGVGVPHANGAHPSVGSYLGVSALDQQTAAAATAAAAGNVFGAVGQVNLEQYTAAAAAAAVAANRPTQSQLEAAAVAAAQFDPFRHLGTAAQATTPVSLNNNTFGLTAATGAGGGGAQSLGAASQTAAHALTGICKSPTPSDAGSKDTKNVEIPEVIVGAILGPNGRSLIEIQQASGANVQISKKGIFAPGTRNRIVTISGQQNAIAKAQYLIEQKINEEESKRARQIPLTTVVN